MSNAAGEILRKGINSLIILGAWTLWTHRNKCVFDGAAPSVAGALAVAEDEERTKFGNNPWGLDIVESPKPVCI